MRDNGFLDIGHPVADRAAIFLNGTPVGELLNPSRVNDAKVYLGGRKPGDLADSALNTVVYQR